MGQSATGGANAAKSESGKPEAPPLSVSVVLLGEKPVRAGTKKKFYDVAAITTMTLTTRARDLTKAGNTLDATMHDVQLALQNPPDVAVIFAGAADQRAHTPDDIQQRTLKAIAGSLTGAGARVYVVPSTPELGTLTAGNLRIAASSSNATYIDTGSQITGQPYFDVMREIRKAEENPKPVVRQTAISPEPEPAAPEATPAPTATSTPTPGPASLSISSMESTASKTEQRAGVFVAPTPAQADDLIQQPVAGTKQEMAQEENTTGPRRITKRGPDAEPATISMKSPPALRNYSPKKPVPRKDVHKKAPDLAR